MTFFPAMVVLGLGMAVSVAPLTTTVMNAVPEKRAGVASGVNNAVSRIAGLLGIAVLGIVIVHSFNRELDRRLTSMNLSPEARRMIDAQRVKLAGADLSSSADEGPRRALKQAIDESFVFGFRLVMLTSLCLALASAFVAFMVIENTQPDR
jgi:ABC-type multidrug transport system fused ATPase/permease subunit